MDLAERHMKIVRIGLSTPSCAPEGSKPATLQTLQSMHNPYKPCDISRKWGSGGVIYDSHVPTLAYSLPICIEARR